MRMGRAPCFPALSHSGLEGEALSSELGPVFPMVVLLDYRTIGIKFNRKTKLMLWNARTPSRRIVELYEKRNGITFAEEVRGGERGSGSFKGGIFHSPVW